MDGVQLVHDVLDACLTDRKHNKVGRADAIVLELSDDAPPRVAAILIGGPVRAERVGRAMVWLRAAAFGLFGRDRSGGVSRVPFSAVCGIGGTVDLDVDGESLPSGHIEQWLGEHVIDRIPGSSGERK